MTGLYHLVVVYSITDNVQLSRMRTTLPLDCRSLIAPQYTLNDVTAYASKHSTAPKLQEMLTSVLASKIAMLPKLHKTPNAPMPASIST
jgi:hypothetical protein